MVTMNYPKPNPNLNPLKIMKNAQMNFLNFCLILFNLKIFGKEGWSQPICSRPANRPTSLPLVKKTTGRF